MALFDIFKKKTEQALKRTKEAWFGKITSLFDRQTIEKGLWDELEELLIAADAGVDTTEKLISRVKERVNKQKISDAHQVRTVLMEEMTSMLQVDGNKPAAAAPPGLFWWLASTARGRPRASPSWDTSTRGTAAK